MYIVSTCPWNHYEFDLESWRFTRRSTKFMIHLRDVFFPEICNWRIVAGDTEGTMVSFSELGDICVQREDGAEMTYRCSNLQIREVCIVPVARGRGFELLAVLNYKHKSSALSNLNGRYYNYFKTIWDFVESDPSCCRPRTCKMQLVDPDGTFNDPEYEIIQRDESPIWCEISKNANEFLTFTPEIEIPTTSPLEIVHISSETYFLITCHTQRSFSLLLTTSTFKVARVLTTGGYESSIPFDVFHDHRVSSYNPLNWHSSEYFLPTPLQESIPYTYACLPEDYEIIDAINTRYRAYRSSGFEKLRNDIMRIVLEREELSLVDVARVCICAPWLREYGFREQGSRRKQLYGTLIDLAWLSEISDLNISAKKRFHCLANSLVLFLVSLKDPQALVMIAESCYFRTRGETRKDVGLAKKYLSMVPADFAGGSVELKKGGEVVRFTLPI